MTKATTTFVAKTMTIFMTKSNDDIVTKATTKFIIKSVMTFYAQPTPQHLFRPFNNDLRSCNFFIPSMKWLQKIEVTLANVWSQKWYNRVDDILWAGLRYRGSRLSVPEFSDRYALRIAFFIPVTWIRIRVMRDLVDLDQHGGFGSVSRLPCSAENSI